MSASYEDAATTAARAMVERLRAGISDATLAAFARVPRHRMVPRFWTLPTVIGGMRTKAVEHRVGDVGVVAGVARPRPALAVNRVASAAGGTTSTASAPQLLAIQADLLALAPGMTVLEIGTGPGYFAAVLSELVGPSGRVVSLDIDEEAATGAAARLDTLGYPNVTVLARDGDAGAPELAPFDRVVGSVGATTSRRRGSGSSRPVAARSCRCCTARCIRCPPRRGGCGPDRHPERVRGDPGPAG